jgi:capsular exopolysaccharide synthesis family protein
MDRIADALERVREEAGPVGVIRPNRTVRPRSEANATGSGEIRYTRTRSVTVSRELLREQRIVAGFEPGSYKDSYKILCTQVLQRLREKGWNALAVTSPGAGEGKSLTAINLAVSLALEVDQTVLLVDADLRSPRIHRHFGLPTGPGLSDYLISNTPLEDILIHPGIGGFVILPGGRPILNSSEMLGSQKMMNLVQELKSRYPSRIVLFDLPPVLSAADALAFAPYVDAAILVVEEGGTDRDEIKRAAEMLGSTNIIGTVLNKSRQIETAGAHEESGKPAGWPWRLFRGKGT